MAKTNAQVAQAFRQGEIARNTNLVSYGSSIWSYGWWEFARWVDGAIITRKGKSYSITTAGKHRNQVYGSQATEETPASQGVMNL